MPLSRRLLLSLTFFALSGCANLPLSSTVQSEESGWQSPLYQDHSLVGRIWRASDQRFISAEEMQQALSAKQFLLLGEKHDNPDHHRLRRTLLQGMLADGALGVVSFEMLDSSQQARVADLSGVEINSAQALQEHLQWDAEGWDWNFYGPVLTDLLSASVPVQAGNISRDEMMMVYGSELDAEVAAVMDAVQMEQLNKDIDESHCGMLPASQFPAMVRVQQSRDASMARSLLGAQELAGKRVLIAGNYHVRRDLGVPNYLAAGLANMPAAAEEDIVTLGFMEVSPESDAPEDYTEAFSAAAPYDYLWFTPAVTSEDYCAAMRAQ
ncbi:MAG: ChaN family lipoprotein [Pseudomonadota bacterium]